MIIIAGRSREEIRQEEKARWEDMSIEDHMEHYISQGLDRKEAMKRSRKTAAFRSEKFIITWRSKNHKKYVLRVVWVKKERTA